MEHPSNRWPWIVLGLAVVVGLLGFGLYATAQPRGVNVTVVTPTPTRLATLPAGPPPTLVQPTSPPLPTPSPLPTSPPPPTPRPTTALLPAPPAPGGPPAPTLAPPPEARATAAPPAPQPTPTPTSARVASPGGLGTTRADFDSAYGVPTGRTAGGLFIYRRDDVDYRVSFTSEPARGILIAMSPPRGAAVPLETARQQARRLLPVDTQNRAAPETRDDVVIERYRSESLGRALPPEVFAEWGGQPGDFIVLLLRAEQGLIGQTIVAVGDDVARILDRARA